MASRLTWDALARIDAAPDHLAEYDLVEEIRHEEGAYELLAGWYDTWHPGRPPEMGASGRRTPLLDFAREHLELSGGVT